MQDWTRSGVREVMWRAALLLAVLRADASMAAFDMTGDWYAGVPFYPFATHWIQTGTVLQETLLFGSGTIDPDSGAFSIVFPLDDGCSALVTAQLSPDGSTFSGTADVASTPPSCPSIDCACSLITQVEFRGSRSPCGDHVVDPGEGCDNGTLGLDSACCALGCTLRPAGEACGTDGNLCTTDVCDGAGACTHPTRPDGSDCSDGLFCNGEESGCLAGACQTGADPCPLDCDETSDQCAASCPASPLSCRAAAKSILLVKVKDDPARDKLVWKWLKGAPTTPAEFGDPTLSGGFALCVYAGTPSALATSASIPPGSGWSPLGSTGFAYDSPGTPHGIERVLLKSSPQNKSKMLIKGAGSDLPSFPLPLSTPVTLQLVTADGLCWGASFSADQLRKNDTGQLRGKAP